MNIQAVAFSASLDCCVQFRALDDPVEIWRNLKDFSSHLSRIKYRLRMRDLVFHLSSRDLGFAPLLKFTCGIPVVRHCLCFPVWFHLQIADTNFGRVLSETGKWWASFYYHILRWLREMLCSWLFVGFGFVFFSPLLTLPNPLLGDKT